MIKVKRQTDPELAALVDEELNRQEHNIEMIASESTAPLAVMELSGSVFTNKTLDSLLYSSASDRGGLSPALRS